MRIGVVSDSHGHVELVRPAIRMLESLEVERVLHCGDIGGAAVVELFAPWPTDFVFGNCDADRSGLARAIEAAGQTCHGEFGDLTIDGVRIALLHSDDARQFQQALHSGEWDLVCYGHTHVAKLERDGATLALNPGALYRANPHSLAVVELPSLQAEIIAL
jgi:putative phosphoesterase